LPARDARPDAGGRAAGRSSRALRSWRRILPRHSVDSRGSAVLPSRASMPRTLPPDGFEREVTTDLKDRTPDKPRGLPLHTRIVIGLTAGLVAGLAANMLLGGDHPSVTWLVYHF